MFKIGEYVRVNETAYNAADSIGRNNTIGKVGQIIKYEDNLYWVKFRKNTKSEEDMRNDNESNVDLFPYTVTEIDTAPNSLSITSI
jgi:hypothetical protein